MVKNIAEYTRDQAYSIHNRYATIIDNHHHRLE